MTRTSSKKDVSHGQLLYKLYVYSGLKQEEFTRGFKRTHQWFNWAKKEKELSPQVISLINAKYNLPDDYWEGKYELPMRGQANEPSADYLNAYESLKKKIEELQFALHERDDRILDLQTQLIQRQQEVIQLKDLIRQYELQR